MKKIRRMSPIIAIAFVAIAASFAGLPFATASVDHAPQQGATMSIPFRPMPLTNLAAAIRSTPPGR